MTLDWQTAIAAILVVSAAAYLLRRGWRVFMRRGTNCGACSNCPADQTSAGKPLVMLDALSKPKSR
jgi:hypothetical protein